jgi:hypothetical protein
MWCLYARGNVGYVTTLGRTPTIVGYGMCI